MLKAALSSPSALIQTMEARRKQLQKDAKSDPRQLAAVDRLIALAGAVTTLQNSKLSALTSTLQDIGVAKGSPTRVVIFSERVQTVVWLAEQLPALLNLPANAVQALHAGLPEPTQQTIIEDFGQADRPLRVLVTSDMSSEGVNLHRQCHQLIHFDVPWSLIRMQQRNGRIDRYGQRQRPQIRALILTSNQSAVTDEQRVATRLLEREHEAQLTLGDVSPIFGTYSIREEEALIGASLAKGDAVATVDAPAASDAFDFFDFLIDPDANVERAAPVPVSDPPRLVADDWTFLIEGLHEVVGDLRRDLDMELDEARRFVAITPPADLRARLNVLPQDVLDERKLKERLKLTAHRAEAEQRLTEAREREQSQSMWPETGWLGAHHPIFDWLVDKLLGRFGRLEAPVMCADVSAPTFLVEAIFTNRRGQATIVEWMAIESPGRSNQRVRPMFEVLNEAKVGPNMANPRRVEGAELRDLDRLIRPAVAAAHAHAKQVRDREVVRLDAQVTAEQQRVQSWHQEALALADQQLKRERVQSTHTELTRYIETLRTEGDPYVRVVAVLAPILAPVASGGAA